MATLPLREVDRVEIVTILDNTVDMLIDKRGGKTARPRPDRPLLLRTIGDVEIGQGAHPGARNREF